jgi:hypothetical protein
VVEIATTTARRVAFVAAAANGLAGALTLLVLRHGLPPVARAARVAYVSSHLVSWRLGWLSWNLAAISLVGLLLCLAARWRSRAALLCIMAVVLATAGLASDLGAEALLAGLTPTSASELGRVQAEGLLLTGYAANGLYTVAGILVTAAGRRELPPELVALGGLVWAAGLLLSAATLVGSTDGEAIATGIAIGSFVVWAVLLGRWFGSLGSSLPAGTASSDGS